MNKENIYISVRDHSVSGEGFDLIYNKDLDVLETTPQPAEDKLGGYYKSEDYISHTDGKRNIFEKTYHFVKEIALKRKLNLINTVSDVSAADSSSGEKKLLDVGCGTGDFLKIAKVNQWTVCGIEPNIQARAIANKKSEGAVFDITHLQTLTPESFDVITLWHVLEHLPNLEGHMNTLEALLKPNGRLIIAVPNYKSYDANYYKSFWAAFDVPRHLWHFSQTAVDILVRRHGMIVQQTAPMLFDAYYVSLLSEKYKYGTMNPFKAFWIGSKSNWKAKTSGEYSSLIYVIKKE